ncbi:MAG: transketolase family protein [Elusimicrobiota bacterium]
MKSSELKPIRNGYGETLREMGGENEKIVVLSADLEDSTRACYFQEDYPERFFTFGISEQDMISEAAGFSKTGFIPFVNSFAVFLTNRPYDQIRISVCYNESNVKLVGSHGGLGVGDDGGTAQSLEDIAIMRVLPNMRVVCPCDALEVKKATRAIAKEDGPFYMRTGRPSTPVITDEDTPFQLGKANVLREGEDVTIISMGFMVPKAMEAAEILAEKGLETAVINMHTVKPIDRETIVNYARKTGAVVTAENHQIYGGLGSAVAEVLATEYPVPLEMVAVDDSFGESGAPSELQKKYKIDTIDIVNKVKQVMERK